MTARDIAELLKPDPYEQAIAKEILGRLHWPGGVAELGREVWCIVRWFRDHGGNEDLSPITSLGLSVASEIGRESKYAGTALAPVAWQMAIRNLVVRRRRRQMFLRTAAL
jgi:hypothetical protein